MLRPKSRDDPLTPVFSLLLIANVTSLEGQVSSFMSTYATSNFSEHSLLSTIVVVQQVVSCKY
jgi:hypothetical protein